MPISPLLEYSLPVVGVELCVVWVIVHYILEPYAMPKVFGSTYTSMDIVARRSLTNHVVAFFLKIVCCCGIYAIVEIFVVKRPLDTPVKTLHSDLYTLTLGDLLAFCYFTIPTIYIFEIIYRAKVSIVSAIHHVGAVTMNTVGLIIILSHPQTGFFAETEFKLMLIYGTFELIFETYPHLTVILYRLRRNRPSFLHKVFLLAACGTFIGTVLEQVAIGMFYHQVWTRLPASYKVVGLILHICFMAAQVQGGVVCLRIACRMVEEAKTRDLEKGELAVNSERSSVSKVDGGVGSVTELQQAARLSIIMSDGMRTSKDVKLGGVGHIPHSPYME